MSTDSTEPSSNGRGLHADQVYADLREFLADMLDVSVEKIQADSHLVNDLDVDSLSVLELTVHTEDTYDVSLEDVFKDKLADVPKDSEAEAAQDVGELTFQWLVATVLAHATEPSATS